MPVASLTDAAAPSATLYLASRLAPTPAFYHALAAHRGPVVICCAERFDKRCKAAHRFVIADTRGPLDLTVPIAKPYGRTWAATRLSTHGTWWETIPAALAPDLLPLLSDPARFDSVGALNAAVDSFVRRALDLTDVDVSYSFDPALRPTEPAGFELAPYWQVRADRLGFIPGLSILDSIFNLGPEARLLL